MKSGALVGAGHADSCKVDRSRERGKGVPWRGADERMGLPHSVTYQNQATWPRDRSARFRAHCARMAPVDLHVARAEDVVEAAAYAKLASPDEPAELLTRPSAIQVTERDRQIPGVPPSITVRSAVSQR